MRIPTGLILGNVSRTILSMLLYGLLNMELLETGVKLKCALVNFLIIILNVCKRTA